MFTNSTVLEYFAEARIADANRQGHEARFISAWRQRLPRVIASHLNIVSTHNHTAAPSAPASPAA